MENREVRDSEGSKRPTLSQSFFAHKLLAWTCRSCNIEEVYFAKGCGLKVVEFKQAAPILPVRSVSAALAHYRRLGFGGTAYTDSWADDPEYGFLTWGPVSLYLARVPSLDPKTSASACYLYVDDADALYATWQAAAVEPN
jgi:hypothetical protein